MRANSSGVSETSVSRVDSHTLIDCVATWYCVPMNLKCFSFLFIFYFDMLAIIIDPP